MVKLKGDLKLNVILKNGLCDKLERAAGGFLNQGEAARVLAMPDNTQQMGELIDVLRGKTNADFRIFCAMLRDCNYKVWADSLEAKARESKGEPGTHTEGRVWKDTHFTCNLNFIFFFVIIESAVALYILCRDGTGCLVFPVH